MSSQALAAEPPPSAPSRPRGRPRCGAAEDRVRCAARQLLEERPFESFCMEEVAARAGVAKTTIYRWWKSKAELAVDAFLSAVASEVPIEAVTVGAARERFRRALRRLTRLYRGPVGRFMRGVAAAALADEAVRWLWWERFFGVRREQFARALREAAEHGQIRADHDPEVVLDLLFGPVIYNLFLQGRPPSDAHVDRVVDAVFDGLETGRA